MRGSGCRRGFRCRRRIRTRTRSTMRRRLAAAATRIAQNDQNLAAEESNSSFDVRHKLSGNWILELPFGPNRAFLNKGGVWAKILDGYSVSGDYTFATGRFADADATRERRRRLRRARATRCGRTWCRGNRSREQGTLKNWFNTAAFSAPPAGTYGSCFEELDSSCRGWCRSMGRCRGRCRWARRAASRRG